MTWRLFMASSMKAAVHLGPQFQKNSEINRNTRFENIENVFNVSQKLIKEQSEEILDVRSLDYSSPSWTSTIKRSNRRRQKFVSALTPFNVLVDRNKVQKRSQDGKVKFKISRDANHIKMLLESMEKQLNSSGKISEDLQRWLFFTREVRGPDHFHVDVQWYNMEETWPELHLERRTSQGLRHEIQTRTLDFLGPGSETRWCGDSHDGQWDRQDNRMVQQFKETGHPIFISTSALSRGVLKRRNGKSTIHFNEGSASTELLFETTHSVNQISFFLRPWRIGAANSVWSCTWKQDARRHAFPKIGKEGTHDAIVRESLLQHLVTAGNF